MGCSRKVGINRVHGRKQQESPQLQAIVSCRIAHYTVLHCAAPHLFTVVRLLPTAATTR